MLPRAYNPIRVVIEQRQEQEVLKDNVYGTTVGAIPVASKKEIIAQFNVYRQKFNALDPSSSGNTDKTKGRLIISMKDYKDQGLDLKIGDKIVEVGPVGDSFTMNAMITNVRPAAPLGGQFLFVVAEFEEDREIGKI